MERMSCFAASLATAAISVIVSSGLAGLSMSIAFTSGVIFVSSSAIFVVSSME